MRGEDLDEVGEQAGRAGDVHGEAVPVAAGDAPQLVDHLRRSARPRSRRSARPPGGPGRPGWGSGGGSGVTHAGDLGEPGGVGDGPLPVGVGDPGWCARRRPGPGWSAGRRTRRPGPGPGSPRRRRAGRRRCRWWRRRPASRRTARRPADHQPGQHDRHRDQRGRAPPRPPAIFRSTPRIDANRHRGSPGRQRSSCRPGTPSGAETAQVQAPGTSRSDSSPARHGGKRPPAGPTGVGGALGSPDWTRTKNLPVNSRLLCQLSYGGLLRRGEPDLSGARRRHKSTGLPGGSVQGVTAIDHCATGWDDRRQQCGQIAIPAQPGYDAEQDG